MKLRTFSIVLALITAIAPYAEAQEGQIRTVNDGNVVLDGVPEIPAHINQQLNRYQNVRSASVSDWSFDGSSIYITTRFGEVSQLHRVDTPGGLRYQITFFSEPVRGATRRPGSSSLVFGMDEGGSEFFQLYVLDPESGAHRRLTDGSSRNQAALWSDDGAMLSFTSTRRNGRSNDVYVMNADDTASARLLLESPDGSFWGASDWNPAGNQLLIVQYVSITDSRLHLVNVETGEQKQLVGGGDRTASYSGISPVFTPDGRRILLATDAYGDFQQLAVMDLASRETEVLTKDIPWNVTELEISVDASRGAFVVNEGEVSRLYLLDPSSLRYELVESVPRGILFGLSFSPDSRRLAFTLNSPLTPSDVFTLDMGESPTEAGRLLRWTYSEVGGLNTKTFVEPELITYPTFDEVDGKPRQIPAFVYRPEGEGPHPVIVSIHGGPESQYRPFFSSTFQMWVNELGAAVIAPNVRGSSGYGKAYVKLDNGYLRENSVKDIGALLDWIATQADLDEQRVGVYGGSYGGYMVLASAVHYSDRLRAAVEIVGVSNFATFLENTQDYRRDLRRAEYGDERDPEMRKFLESIAPSNHADKITVPLFVAQGQNDPRVPVTESEQIVREVRASGHDVWYMNALNEGHGFRKKENRDLFGEIAVLFFKTHLLGEQPVSIR